MIDEDGWYDFTQRDAEGMPRAFGGRELAHSQQRAASYAKRYGRLGWGKRDGR
jgi:hypothetical protein